YMETLPMASGLRIKLGRFGSELGYPHQNHPGQWGYSQGHVPYWFLKKPFYLQDTGVQLTWSPQTTYYARLGMEAFQGDDALLGRFDGASVLEGAGLGEHLVARYGEPREGPRLFTAFAEVAPNLGYPHQLQGSMFGVLSADHQELRYSPTPELLNGKYWLAGTDWVYAYRTRTSAGSGQLKVSAEYLYSEKDLDVAYQEGAPQEVGDQEATHEEGYYLQARYGFEPDWNADVRFDVVGLVSGKGQVTATGAGGWDTSTHIAAQGTWSPTPHSSLQARWSHTDNQWDSYGASTNRITLRFSMSLGHYLGNFL
ncbi:MAG TPA: hypothetical protein VKA48_07095, partial [Gammaproteobacteria bacterium]|nr:hypothetical protein [Gammaproteobacteria bacterium]